MLILQVRTRRTGTTTASDMITVLSRPIRTASKSGLFQRLATYWALVHTYMGCGLPFLSPVLLGPARCGLATFTAFFQSPITPTSGSLSHGHFVVSESFHQHRSLFHFAS